MKVRAKLNSLKSLKGTFDKIAKALIEEFPDGGDIVIQVHRVPPDIKNERARRYYWLLCRLITEFMIESGYNGFSINEVHERNKKLYMSADFIDYLAMKPYQQGQSSTVIESHEWPPIFEAIKQEWAERGLNLPDKNARTLKGTPYSSSTG